MTFQIQYFNHNVQKSILLWPSILKAEYLRMTELLERFGMELGLPYSKCCGKGLFELRLSSRNQIARVFYCFLNGKRIIFLHSFIKKTKKIPKKELKIARKRLQEVLNHEK